LLKTQRIYKKADKEHVTGANRVKKATKSAGKCSVTAKTVKTPFFLPDHVSYLLTCYPKEREKHSLLGLLCIDGKLCWKIFQQSNHV